MSNENKMALLFSHHRYTYNRNVRAQLNACTKLTSKHDSIIIKL